MIRFTVFKSLEEGKGFAAIHFTKVYGYVPVTVAERSKACTVFARSEAGIVGSNPKQGLDVLCVWAFSVFMLSCV
jgi:hypothetical protein